MAVTPRILRVVPLLFLVGAFACSQTPRMSQEDETEYIRMLRSEFFETHPDGQYNEYIARGEVVRGMDFLEVLASWGNPGKRERPSPTVEYWLYEEKDESSKDWVRYKFVFRDNVLNDWELTRHVSEGGMGDVQNESSAVLSKGSGVSGASGGVPTKK
jgi:hypothetical protein